MFLSNILDDPICRPIKVVFYQGEECLGGVTINQVYRDKKQLTYVG